MILRFTNNPIIKPADFKPVESGFKVVSACNCAATEYNHRIVLLIRVEEVPEEKKGYFSASIFNKRSGRYSVSYISNNDPELDTKTSWVIRYKNKPCFSGISRLYLAISEDGKNFKINKEPSLYPEKNYEEFGIQDPRITFIDDTYYITYVAVSSYGIVTCLAKTKDFIKFTKLGIIFGPDNKDVAIFPTKIKREYWCFHRPGSSIGKLSIWLAASDNIMNWGNHILLISPRKGMWDSERVGAGAPPIRTHKGWLEIYHGKDDNGIYSLGILLLDLKKPFKIIARSRTPILKPEMWYEQKGITPNVIFSTGIIQKCENKIIIYYGAADTVTCAAEIDTNEIINNITETT